MRGSGGSRTAVTRERVFSRWWRGLSRALSPSEQITNRIKIIRVIVSMEGLLAYRGLVLLRPGHRIDDAHCRAGVHSEARSSGRAAQNACEQRLNMQLRFFAAGAAKVKERRNVPRFHRDQPVRPLQHPWRAATGRRAAAMTRGEPSACHLKGVKRAVNDTWG